MMFIYEVYTIYVKSNGKHNNKKKNNIDVIIYSL